MKKPELLRKSVGAALLIALGVLSYFLLDWGLSALEYFLVLFALLLALALLSHRLLLNAADKKYCLTE